ncbi:aromatic acid exporter family protein [Aeribacillus pallidus]|jgi:uncharacterized membrane protein YgaE (UPF0421/DUF939 family)|uniref:aromatic acid exporter family protein n=1 Tax=Aeribacillus pallidus TaxID=33936 RepID=UPI001E194C6B|nr:aromatic acid exporter family protein [Bacillus sp. (in: firmicutes)]
MKIGYRTLKTSIGTAISIWLAQQFGLVNYVSAGIITILCIQITKKKSLFAAWTRLVACLVGMGFSFLFFEGISYHPIAIGIMLLFFIPTVVMLKAKEGIVTSSVIILHIYDYGDVSRDLILNELGLIIIGIGVALIVNMYMPSVEKDLIDYQEKIERNFQKIFQEIVTYLRTNESDWDGEEITETSELLAKAKSLAFRDVENHVLRKENLYYKYFHMREKQFEIIERVLPLITSIRATVEQGKMIADFIEELSQNIHPGNTALIYLQKLYKMKAQFEQMDLPKTREEFETRAALVQFVKEMEQYLLIKSSFQGIPDKRRKRRKQ